jgi:hypothetical protein
VLIFQDGLLEGLPSFESEGALEATQHVLLFAPVFGLSPDYGQANLWALAPLRRPIDASV